MTGTKGVWAGRVLSALAAVFLAFDSAIKLMRLPVVLDAQAGKGVDAAAAAIMIDDSQYLIAHCP